MTQLLVIGRSSSIPRYRHSNRVVSLIIDLSIRTCASRTRNIVIRDNSITEAPLQLSRQACTFFGSRLSSSDTVYSFQQRQPLLLLLLALFRSLCSTWIMLLVLCTPSEQSQSLPGFTTIAVVSSEAVKPEPTTYAIGLKPRRTAPRR